MRMYGFSLVLVLAFSNLAFAQDTTAKPPPSNESASEVAQPSVERMPAAKGPNGERALRQEHVIYLPYENLRDVFEDEDSSIVLPYSQFLEMWNRLAKPDQPPRTPPINGVITRADYVGSVKGDVVHLEATLDVEVLCSGWARLPVEFGDAAIGSAETEDGSVLLRGVGDGRYELLVQGQGKHQIKLHPGGRCQIDCRGTQLRGTVPGRRGQQPGTGNPRKRTGRAGHSAAYFAAAIGWGRYHACACRSGIHQPVHGQLATQVRQHRSGGRSGKRNRHDRRRRGRRRRPHARYLRLSDPAWGCSAN